VTRLALIHTVGSLAPVFSDLASELLPGVDTTSTVDEALLGETIEAGRIQPATAERLERHVRTELDGGADLVLVTCSSVGPAVESIATGHGWPLLRIDEAMADRAIELGDRIGVLATLSTTLEPTADLIRRRAEVRGGGRTIQISALVVDGAFKALKAGNVEEHDRLVREALTRLIPEVDVVVLAQASMARVAGTLPPEIAASRPILSSPRLAIERVADRLARRLDGET
jgi:Asp/Glu/hydantoin racemase